MSSSKVRIELELDDNGMAKALQIDTNSIVQLSEAFNHASKNTKSFGSIVEVAIGNLAATAFQRLADAIQSIPAGVLRLGTQVESSLAELSAITGIAGKDLERLGQTAVSESMRTGVAAADQIEAFKLLASNIDIATAGGVAGLEKLGQQVILLKQAAGVDLAQATDIVAGAINAFGLEASESERVVNLLAAGSKFGAAEVTDLGAALKNSAATARGANVSIEETVGALEVMSQNFLKGGEAGTGLRNVISILQTEANKLADAGLSGINIESDGLQATLVKLTPLLDDAAALTEVFVRENASAARILIQNAEAVGTMTEKVTGTNTAYEQAAIRTDTFQGSLDKLLTTIQGVGIGIFEEYSDELKGIVDTTIDLINYLRENKEVVLTIAQALGMAAAAVAAYNAVVKIQALVTNAATIAQRLLNIAMRLNPVGLVISALTLLTLLVIKFRDKIAALAAIFVQFGITAIKSMKAVSGALGLGLVDRAADAAIAKLETLQGKLLDVAAATSDAFGGAGATGVFEDPNAAPSRGALKRPTRDDDTTPTAPKQELEDEIALLKKRRDELIKTGEITEELIRLNSRIAEIEAARNLAAKGSITEKVDALETEKLKEKDLMALHIRRTESELDQAARRIRA
ncbi:MAG TPA: phage tail tape measure protein, partial [Kiloniellaceae bacterium]|nr:phage tail tape measure protein [Kiloniellaceae bacterium]